MAEDRHEEILCFEAFRALMAKELMLPEEEITFEASLLEDLQVDSLAMASMMLRLEEEGILIPLERAWEIETVGDAYQAYLEGMERGKDTPGQEA